jgi:hypothetical protein
MPKDDRTAIEIRPFMIWTSVVLGLSFLSFLVGISEPHGPCRPPLLRIFLFGPFAVLTGIFWNNPVLGINFMERFHGNTLTAPYVAQWVLIWVLGLPFLAKRKTWGPIALLIVYYGSSLLLLLTIPFVIHLGEKGMVVAVLLYLLVGVAALVWKSGRTGTGPTGPRGTGLRNPSFLSFVLAGISLAAVALVIRAVYPDGFNPHYSGWLLWMQYPGAFQSNIPALVAIQFVCGGIVGVIVQIVADRWEYRPAAHFISPIAICLVCVLMAVAQEKHREAASYRARQDRSRDDNEGTGASLDEHPNAVQATSERMVRYMYRHGGKKSALQMLDSMLVNEKDPAEIRKLRDLRAEIEKED